MDGQVKVNGYRIELGDLEANLRGLPEIADAVVLPLHRRQSRGSRCVRGTLGPREGSDFAVSSRLKKAWENGFLLTWCPGNSVFLDAFPMTPNGKADRQAGRR